ncbi:flagellar biosynthesis anti-sigma factor FlgM [uncultured Selenomonas sp.]|jgi:negative regulator of flagellin synthesis FlgM|uniref:flagellar biosynthesis anti-sigma factor FlgM n=1 Tax=uncultured Selenomonas sp. TaxID=159275 RepID=UPI0025F1171C|nr:flagellar biosynthesis anti-sigma factor FlgM [uncultured Selenomonas sp.]
MIINNSIQSVTSLYGAAQPSRAYRAKQAADEGIRDEVEISADGQNFSEMLQKLRETPDVRQDKVDFYSQAIADGTYQVSSENLAAAMLGRI